MCFDVGAESSQPENDQRNKKKKKISEFSQKKERRKLKAFANDS